MSENTMPEQDEVALNAKPEPGAEGLDAVHPSEDRPVEVPAELREVDPEKMAKLREKIRKFVTSEKKTSSGSEAPVEGTPAENTGSVTTGKDVDWSEYELDFSVRHLYKDATFRETPQGPKWVAMLDEFISTERDFRNYGKKTEKGELMNLGQYLSDMLNGPEGWRIVSILPTSGGRAGIMLQRTYAYVLPDPKPLKKETEVAAPTDPELQRTEDAALAFMEKEGLTPGTPAGDTGVGGVEAKDPASLEDLALSINPPTERVPTGENQEPDIALAAGVEVAQKLADGTIRVLPVAEQTEE